MGDRVKVVDTVNHIDLAIGTKGTVIYVDTQDVAVQFEGFTKGSDLWPIDKECALLSDCSGWWFSDDTTVIEKIAINDNSKGVTNMATPQQLRDLKLSEDDRLLQEAGFVYRDGTLSESGQEAVLDKAFALVRDDILTDLKALKAKQTAEKSN